MKIEFIQNIDKIEVKKKIKIIDILCYISIGEYDKLPEEFKYAGYCWFWCLSCLTYETRDKNNKEINLYDYLARNGDLNDEVEILDEEAEFEDIEEIDVALLGECDNWLRCPTNKVTKQDIELNPYIINNIRENTLEFQHKINDLIKNQKKIIERLEKEGK